MRTIVTGPRELHALGQVKRSNSRRETLLSSLIRKRMLHATDVSATCQPVGAGIVVQGHSLVVLLSPRSRVQLYCDVTCVERNFLRIRNERGDSGDLLGRLASLYFDKLKLKQV